MWYFFPFFFTVLVLISKEFFVCNEEFLVGFLFFCVTTFCFKNLEKKIKEHHFSEVLQWEDKIHLSFQFFFDNKKKEFIFFDILKNLFFVVQFFILVAFEKKAASTPEFPENTVKLFYILFLENVFFLYFIFEKRAIVFFSKFFF